MFVCARARARARVCVVCVCVSAHACVCVCVRVHMCITYGDQLQRVFFVITVQHVLNLLRKAWLPTNCVYVKHHIIIGGARSKHNRNVIDVMELS